MLALPPVTRAILIANIVVFLLQFVAGNLLLSLFALWPVGDTLFQPWQLLTYSFLHAGFLHIFFNMFALYMFGTPLEAFWGSRRFAFYYVACVLTAAATELVVQNATEVGGPVLGASGGVFGLLLAFAWYFPKQRLMLLFPPIPMPAWLFVTIYGAFELVLGVTGAQPGVAHFAHLGGMLGGALSILYWRARGRFTG
ncbi:MAG: rane protein [Gammaproteobacteria bacterium]|jgi:membrane associated rhomboid family serine protease|nr:rane protein [Gammaproteobacteria bacterium]